VELEPKFTSPSPSPAVPPRVPVTPDFAGDKKEQPKADSSQFSADSDANTPQKYRKSQLHSLVGMLTEQGLYASTDDELLDGTNNNKKGKKSHQSKMAIKSGHGVPRDDKKQASSQPFEASSDASVESLSSNVRRYDSVRSRKSSSSLQISINRKGSASFRSMQNFPFLNKNRDQTEKKWETDSDNSDFEIFIPPPKKNSKEFSNNLSMLQKRFSVKPAKATARQKDANPNTDVPPASQGESSCSSTYPEQASVNSTKRDDRVQSTANPSVSSNKRKAMLSSTKRAMFGKSISSDSFYYESVKDEEVYDTLSEGDLRSVSEPELSSNNSGEEDCTGGTVVDFNQMLDRTVKMPCESSLSTLTQEMISSSRGVEDNDLEHDYNSDEGCTYLDPKELESQPALRRSSKVQYPASDEEISSTYLSLLDINQISTRLADGHKTSQDSSSKGPLQQGTKPFPQKQSSFRQHIAKSSSSLNINALQDKWRAESSCASGYSTDSSCSNWEPEVGGDLDRSALDLGSKLSLSSCHLEGTDTSSNLDFVKERHKAAPRLSKASQSCSIDHGEGDIYAQIDDFDVEVDGSDEREESDYIPSEKYVSLFKKSPTHSICSVTTVGSTCATESPPNSVSISSGTSEIDKMYETLYSTGVKGGTVKTLPHLPPSLPPRLKKKFPRDVERAGMVVRRHASVPAVSVCVFVCA